jgi:IS5 family transposase
MQRQGSFSQAEYAGKKKQTRRDRFLAEMEEVVPWARLVEGLRSFYPKGERGQPPIGLEDRGLLMRQGTIVDATIIDAPPSTKNKSKARDPEMHQTKKGNQWHLGMKAHIGVDVASGVVHTVTGTAANEADINQTAALLRGREEAVFTDAGYTGAEKRPELEDCDVSWNIAIKRGIIKAVESALSQVRAWVEHPFHIVKNLFRHKKLRYRGLTKNTAQPHTLFALANLVIVRKTPLAQGHA